MLYIKKLHINILNELFFKNVRLVQRLFDKIVVLFTSVFKKAETKNMSQSVRVRFAPSPTGPLHIGGVRTALYNYLFAKKNNGTFILRIEDTDQKRYVAGAEDYIEETLEWLNMMPNESKKAGGNHGPYRQSERKELYQKYAKQLLDDGHAYYAFDTPEELDAMREQLIADGNPAPQYNAEVRLTMSNSLTLTDAEVQEKIANGTPYVLRLKVEPGETIVIHDLVKGNVTVASEEIDDKVLMKADGMPTYHLANIVDDHLMEITHVIRGEEWLPSTPLHVLLYRYFGWEDTMPEFIHLPLILKPSPESYINKKNIDSLTARLVEEFFRKNPAFKTTYQDQALATTRQLLQDTASLSARLKPKKKDKEEKIALKEFLKSTLYGKLSKRDGDRLGFPVFPLSWEGDKPEDSFVGFREFGFMPQAVINFLAFLGWNPGTEQEMFSMEELIETFTLDRISKSGARFNFDKAMWYNQQYLIQTSDDNFVQLLRPMVEAHGHQPTDSQLLKMANLFKERANVLPDFWTQGYYLFEKPTAYDEKTVLKKWKPEIQEVFVALKNDLAALNSFDAATLETTIKGFINDRGLKFGDVFSNLRNALTGVAGGPSLFDIMAFIGKEECLTRLDTAFATW